MTPHLEGNHLESIFQWLIQNGVEGISKLIQNLYNEAMKIERSNALKAQPHERTDQRIGYANGFKDKTLATTFGKLNLKIPQVRDSNFYPQTLERGNRAERALKLAIAEAYVQGVSTRKVSAILETLCGTEISSTQVSRIAKLLDEDLSAFRNRPLGAFPVLFLDARYEKVRFNGMVQDLTVLIAVGVNSGGYREVLGVSVKISEAETHWRDFLQSLTERGLAGLKIIVSDDHAGLKAARTALFPSVPWQRCQFHLIRNALAYGNSITLKKNIARTMKAIFAADDIHDARSKVKKTVAHLSNKIPRFSNWLEQNIEEGFAIYSFPPEIRKKLRTTNPLERLNREIKRRTRVVSIFPNPDSCLRLVSALLLEYHEEWITGKKYLNLEGLNRKPRSRIYRKEVA